MERLGLDASSSEGRMETVDQVVDRDGLTRPAPAFNDPVTGKRFLDEIIAAGGARPALENFRAFRGRDPQVDALLRHSGMIAA